MNKRPVFEQLVILCTRLDKENNQNAWNYLIENDLSDLNTIDSSPAKVCWNLLRKLIDKYQPEYCTEIFQVVARKLVSLNIQVPQWILKPYKVSYFILIIEETLSKISDKGVKGSQKVVNFRDN